MLCEAHKMGFTKFKGSMHWINDVFERNNLTIRVTTHRVRRDSSITASEMLNFYNDVNRLAELYDVSLDFILNMDETAISFGLDKPKTVTVKGTKEVFISLKNYSRNNMTLALLVNAAGEKLQ